MIKRMPIFALLFCSLLCSGCNFFLYPLYLVLPDLGKKDVPAEYSFEPGSRVAIAIYANMDTLFEYPFIREELSDAISAQFIKHVPNAEVVDYALAIRYQDSNVYWHTQPLAEMGKKLDADYVLYISVNEFKTYDHGSISLPHGIMNASSMLIKTEDSLDDAGKPLPQRAVWTRSVISIDEDASVGPLFENNSMLRQVVELKFSMKLAKAFYVHSEGGHDQMPE